MDDETTLKIFSLNCWGIPFVSKNRKERMKAIAENLCTADWDVVCLQEVWSVDDYKMMKAKLYEKLPHSHYFFSGVVGSGLCIFTRFPIKDVMFHKWSLNGYVHKIHHGDWFGGKGVGLCRLRVKDINVNVYVAHLHAEYNTDNDEYMSHRVLQAFDTAQFIRMTEASADAAFLGGDLNTGPQDLAYKIIHGIAGLEDACSPESSNDCGTNERGDNSYTASRIAAKRPKGKRIDHIMCRGSNKLEVEVLGFGLPLPRRVPDKPFSFSDHEAVAATFKLKMGKCEAKPLADMRETMKQALTICEESMRRVQRQRAWYLIACCVLIVPLIWSMGLDSTSRSIGVAVALNVARLFGTAILLYAFFMSTIWNSVERNALRAGYLAMEVHLLQLANNLALACG